MRLKLVVLLSLLTPWVSAGAMAGSCPASAYGLRHPATWSQYAKAPSLMLYTSSFCSICLHSTNDGDGAVRVLGFDAELACQWYMACYCQCSSCCFLTPDKTYRAQVFCYLVDLSKEPLQRS